jgi:hypothetical protein
MSAKKSKKDQPLTEASGDTIADLFARDPLDLTDAEVDRIIDELRKKRVEWFEEETRAKAEGRRALPSAGVKLEDLGL